MKAGIHRCPVRILAFAALDRLLVVPLLLSPLSNAVYLTMRKNWPCKVLGVRLVTLSTFEICVTSFRNVYLAL